MRAGSASCMDINCAHAAKLRTSHVPYNFEMLFRKKFYMFSILGLGRVHLEKKYILRECVHLERVDCISPVDVFFCTILMRQYFRP
jgi:hypothetical protein